MTLKIRNRYILSVFILSVLSGISIVALFCYKVFLGTFDFNFSFTSYTLFSKNSISAFAAFAIFILYVPITGLYIYLNFEKTQSTEIIYFIFFLIGTLLETTRCFIPLLNLVNTYSPLLLLCCKTVFFGRLICLMNFFGAAVSSDSSKRQVIERNLTILIVLALFCTIIVPINTANINSEYNVKYGNANLVYAFFTILIILTILAFVFLGKQTENKDYLKLILGILVLIIGKHVLCYSGVPIVVLIGASLMFFGSRIYLDTIHKINLWE